MQTEMDRLIPMCKLQRTYMDKEKAFSLIEMLFVTAIFIFVVIAVFSLLGNAQSSFFNSDTATDVRNNLRIASEKISLELRNTGYQSNTAQFTIQDSAGYGNSDIIRFSMPILCSSTSTLLDTNGNPSYWGAPLNWGCNTYTCMDANGSCSTLEYKYVQYEINSSNQLIRKILDGSFATVSNSSSIITQNISNMQISLSVDTHMMTIVLSGVKTSPNGKTVTVTHASDVLLNNLGG